MAVALASALVCACAGAKREESKGAGEIRSELSGLNACRDLARAVGRDASPEAGYSAYEQCVKEAGL